MNIIKKFLLLLPLIVISDEFLDVKEISYGNNEKQKIDFYRGKSDKVLIWIHGGGWLFGDKRAERWIKRFQNHFVDYEKYNVYMVGYRIGKSTAPYAVDDVLCAYKSIISDASSKNLSTSDIVVAGASAGGHLALMVGLSNKYINMSNFDLNIQNYSQSELQEIFDLQPGYQMNTLLENESKLIESIKKDNDASNTKTKPAKLRKLQAPLCTSLNGN